MFAFWLVFGGLGVLAVVWGIHKGMRTRARAEALTRLIEEAHMHLSEASERLTETRQSLSEVSRLPSLATKPGTRSHRPWDEEQLLATAREFSGSVTKTHLFSQFEIVRREYSGVEKWSKSGELLELQVREERPQKVTKIDVLRRRDADELERDFRTVGDKAILSGALTAPGAFG